MGMYSCRRMAVARSAKYAKTVAGADKPQRSARQKVHSLACWPAMPWQRLH